MLGLWQILLEEPLLDRCEQHWSYHLRLLPLVPQPYRPHRSGHRRQLSNRLMLEELFGGQLPKTGLSSTSNDLQAQNGVASQRKEVLVNAHMRKTEHLLPDGCQNIFNF